MYAPLPMIRLEVNPQLFLYACEAGCCCHPAVRYAVLEYTLSGKYYSRCHARKKETCFDVKLGVGRGPFCSSHRPHMGMLPDLRSMSVPQMLALDSGFSKLLTKVSVLSP